MDLDELKRQHIRDWLGINPEQLPHILTFIDFANVNKWYEQDELAEDGTLLPINQHLAVDLRGLKSFLDAFSIDIRFYYGTDFDNTGSGKFMGAARFIFGNRRVFTKPMQKIKHYLEDGELAGITRAVKIDGSGKYIVIPKSNFDVEITLDSVRLIEDYDSYCLLSGDADFAPLLRHLKKLGKKTILIKGGFIQENLRRFADLVISAQDIKSYIAMKKQKPGHGGPVFADSQPVSTGRAETGSAPKTVSESGGEINQTVDSQIKRN